MVGVLEMPFQGAEKAVAEKGRAGVEQMEWSNSEMTMKARRRIEDG